MSWLQKLSAALVNEADKIPAGWFDAKSEQKRLKAERRTLYDKLNAALRLGVIERRKFRVVLNGKFRQVYYYREVK